MRSAVQSRSWAGIRFLVTFVLLIKLRGKFIVMGDNIVVVALECQGCDGKNRYHIRKNKKVQRDKLEIKKYCKLCNKHLIHKETK